MVHKFNIGDVVLIKELETKARIRSIHLYKSGLQYAVRYFSSGTLQEVGLYEDELQKL